MAWDIWGFCLSTLPEDSPTRYPYSQQLHYTAYIKSRERNRSSSLVSLLLSLRLLSSYLRQRAAGERRSEFRKMKIFVKTLKGTNFEIEAKPEDTVKPASLSLSLSTPPKFLYLRLIFPFYELDFMYDMLIFHR